MLGSGLVSACVGRPRLAFILFSTLLVGASVPAAAQTQTEPGRDPTGVEVPALRSEFGKVFRNSDGTLTAELSTRPLHYEKPDGTWAPVDPTLMATGSDGYAWRNVGGPLDLRFAQVATAGAIASVGSEGRSISFGLLGNAAPAIGHVEGSRVTYAGVLPGVDLVYEAKEDALKELIVLREAPKEAVSFRFSVDLEGLTPRVERDGAISLLSPGGDVELFLPAASMVDARVDAQSAERAFSEDVELELAPSGSEYVLTLTPDLGWLQDPERVYPVEIDPTVTTGITLDTFVQIGITSGQAGSDELKAGTFDGGSTKARSLVKFNLAGLHDKEIISATFSLYEWHSWSCTASEARASRVNDAWNGSVNWANQPTAAAAFDTINAAKGFSGSCSDGRINFDASGPVTSWTNGVDNHGIRVRAGDEDNNNGWKKFRSEDFGGASTDPKLEVTYNSYPTSPNGCGPTSGTISTDTTPTFSCTYNDPDAGDAGHVDYQVCGTSNCSTVILNGNGSNVQPGQPSAWTVPGGGALTSGQTYWWRSRGDDGRVEQSWIGRPIWTYTPNQPPDDPTDLAPPSAVYTSTTPTLSATYEDADAGDQGQVFFEVYDGALLVASGSGSALSGETASWTVTPALSPNHAYTWRAQGRDEQASAWSLPVDYETHPAVGELPRYQFDRTLPTEDPDEPVEVLAAEISVNTATGNLLVREMDVHVVATGMDVEVERYYNSQSGVAGVLSAGWGMSTGTDIRIDVQADGSVTLFGPTGFVDTFIELPDGSFQTPSGVQGTLVENGDGTYALTLDDPNDTLTFASTGRLVERSIEDGTTQVLAYDGSGRLASITDPDEGETTFDYDATSGRLIEIVEPAEGAHIYEYDAFGRLVTHRDPQDREATFEYTDGLLSSITDREGTETRFSYDAAARVTSKIEVTDPIAGTGPTTEYTYNTDNTVVEDPNGMLTTYYAQQAPAPTVVRHVTAGSGAPSLQLGGSLASSDGATLAQSSVHDLLIDSSDGNGLETLAIAVDDSLVEEVACEENDCEHSWSFETSEYVPGEHAIRTWATDELGNRRLRALIVKVPPWEPPPTVAQPAGQTEDERFAAAHAFREWVGMNTDAGHIELLDQDPSAQAAVFLWGVPLTSAELAIMEDRQQIEQDAAYADAYVATSTEASSAYAGSYLDPSDGTMHVGFTEDASEHLAEMVESFPQPGRLEVYTAEYTLAELEGAHDAIDADLSELVTEGIDIREVTLLEDENIVRVGVANLTGPEEFELVQTYGPAIDVVEASGPEPDQPEPVDEPFDRYQRYPRIHAGLNLRDSSGSLNVIDCTSNVSAYRRMNSGVVRYFHVTAGHCAGYDVGQVWYQGGRRIGVTVQDYYVSGSRVDGELIRATRQRSSKYMASSRWLLEFTAVERLGPPHDRSGAMVCKAGVYTGVTCGPIRSVRNSVRYSPNGPRLYRQRKAGYIVFGGDSGGIVYRPLTRRKAVAIGIHSGSRGPRDELRDVSFYSHLRWAENDMQVRICIKGRVRCGR